MNFLQELVPFFLQAIGCHVACFAHAGHQLVSSTAENRICFLLFKYLPTDGDVNCPMEGYLAQMNFRVNNLRWQLLEWVVYIRGRCKSRCIQMSKAPEAASGNLRKRPGLPRVLLRGLHRAAPAGEEWLSACDPEILTTSLLLPNEITENKLVGRNETGREAVGTLTRGTSPDGCDVGRNETGREAVGKLRQDEPGRCKVGRDEQGEKPVSKLRRDEPDGASCGQVEAETEPGRSRIGRDETGRKAVGKLRRDEPGRCVVGRDETGQKAVGKLRRDEPGRRCDVGRYETGREAVGKLRRDEPGRCEVGRDETGREAVGKLRRDEMCGKLWARSTALVCCMTLLPLTIQHVVVGGGVAAAALEYGSLVYPRKPKPIVGHSFLGPILCLHPEEEQS
ncbi:Protein of unknown function [Gryllus bimaculatus]|nr:Protein of unknown function [Gryllus bimaculatus]